jgi:hypothetical protein
VEGGDWVLGVGADGYAVYIVVGKSGTTDAIILNVM